MALPVFLLAVSVVFRGQATAGEGAGFESASGVVPPGGSISTLDGPLNADDPFAVALKNVSDTTLDVTIEEEACDGTQEGDPLCSTPRVGGVAGDFMFQPSGKGGGEIRGSSAPPVVVARLFYDVSVLEGVEGFRIFYQKSPDSPVLRLQRCDDGIKTECFRTKKQSNGDQIVRVPFKDDPRVTRGCANRGTPTERVRPSAGPVRSHGLMYAVFTVVKNSTA